MFSLLLSTFAMMELTFVIGFFVAGVMRSMAVMGVKTSAGGSQNIPEIIVGFIMVSVPVNRREV